MRGLLGIVVLAGGAFMATVARAQPLATTFTYQGEVGQAGQPTAGPVDLRFRLYDSQAGPGQIGVQLVATGVELTSGGRFAVNLDFGGSAFSGSRRWLEIDVRLAGSGTYTTLSPRQELTATPNATFAAAAGQATNAATATNATRLNGQDAAFYQNAANLNGALNDARLSANVPRLNTTQTFSGQQTFSTQPVFSSASAPFLVSSTTMVANLNADLLDGQQGSFYLNAGNLTGTLLDARLSSNVPLLNATQTFSGQQTFSTQPVFSSASVPFLVSSATMVANLNADLLDGQQGSFYLNAGNLTGTLLDARLSSNVSLLNATQTFSGRPAFNGGTPGISSPFTVDSAMVVPNLNADVLDGFDATEFGRIALANTWSGINTYNDLRLQLRNSGNSFSTTLSAGATSAARTVTFPDASGTVITTGNLASISSVGANAINSSSIVDGSITSADLAASAISGSNIADASIQTADLANSAVTNAKLAVDAVSGSNIIDGGIQTPDLAVDAITAPILAFDPASLNRVSGSRLFSSNGNIGVGTSSPGFPFTVRGTTNELSHFESNSTGGTWMGLANTSGGGRIWSLISSGSGNGEGAGNLLVRNSTAGNVPLTILGSSGNIGMGTTAPQVRLSVVGGINVDEGNANTGTYVNSLRFGSFSGESIGSNRNAGTNAFGLDFYTSTTRRMSITNTGNVGIGTPSPSTTLDVAGIVRSSSGGFRFPDGTTQLTAQVAGPEGPQGPVGPRGPQGIPGQGSGSWITDGCRSYSICSVDVRDNVHPEVRTQISGARIDFFSNFNTNQRTIQLNGASGDIDCRDIDSGNIDCNALTASGSIYTYGALSVVGNFTCTGLKFFSAPNPRDPETTINYICAEAPEPQMIIRGTAELINGEAFITLPQHFTDIAEDTGLTVQVTPLSEWSLGLAVIEKRLSGIRVRELLGGRGNYEFDYAITGIRAGFDDYKVIQPKRKPIP